MVAPRPDQRALRDEVWDVVGGQGLAGRESLNIWSKYLTVTSFNFHFYSLLAKFSSWWAVRAWMEPEASLNFMILDVIT